MGKSIPLLDMARYFLLLRKSVKIRGQKFVCQKKILGQTGLRLCERTKADTDCCVGNNTPGFRVSQKNWQIRLIEH